MPPAIVLLRLRCTIVLIASSFVLVSCAHRPETRAPAPWPHQQSDLKPDPAVLWGRLENGLRYAILPQGRPRSRLSVNLHVQVGSWHERDHERGYAHFVEHLAFRGTQAFPAESGIAALQQLGATFGPHVNATTGPFETEYRLHQLPTDEPAALATALKILRGMSDGIVFTDEVVNRERGVIFSEGRSRQSQLIGQAWRDQLEYLPPRSAELRGLELHTLFAGTRLNHRGALGTEKTLNKATADLLRAFYERWYRPERMIVAITGDVAPAQAEQLVRETFGSMAGRGAPPVEPTLRDRPFFMARHGIEERDAEPFVRLTLAVMLPEAGIDSSARRRRTLARRFALGMLGERLESLAGSADAPFVSTDVFVSHEVPGRELVLIRADAQPALWPRARAALETEVHRAFVHGFSAEELRSVGREISSRAATEARQIRRESAAVLARALTFAAARGIVFTAPEEDLRWMEAELDRLTVDECSKALREALPARNRVVALSGPLGGATPPPRRASLWPRLPHGAEIPTFVPQPATPFPYTDFGPPGVVVKRERSAAFDAELLEFANGVRLNLKRTDFEPGRFRFNARFGGGRLAVPAEQPGLDFRVFSWVFSGLRDLSWEEERAALREFFSGDGNFTLTASSDTFEWAGEADATMVRGALQGTAAHFAHPAFRADAWIRGFEFAREALAPYESTARGVARNTLLRHLSSRHPALYSPGIAQAAQRTREEFEQWFAPQIAIEPIELTLVGDYDPGEAIDMVARTFGALPPRTRDDRYAERRRVTPPAQPLAETMAFDGPEGVAAVLHAWPTDAVSSAERFRGRILASILEDRLRLKLVSEMGETYSPSAEFARIDGFPGLPAFLCCIVETAPGGAEKVASTVREIAAALARDGATPAEFERARRPLVRQAEAEQEDNAWWLAALSTAQRFPEETEALARALPAYQAATVAEINSLAGQLFVPERQSELIVLPRAAVAETVAAWVDRGGAKLDAGDIAGAIAEYDRAIALDPENPVLFRNRAVAHSRRGDLDNELADYDRALALNPDYVDVLHYRGLGRRAKGDWAGALLDYDRVIALEPSRSGALEQRAEIRRKLGDEAGARADEKRARD